MDIPANGYTPFVHKYTDHPVYLLGSTVIICLVIFLTLLFVLLSLLVVLNFKFASYPRDLKNIHAFILISSITNDMAGCLAGAA